jgi:hypothetical protein
MAQSNRDPTSISTIESLINVISVQAQSPEQAYQWLGAYCQQEAVCNYLEEFMKVIICVNTPGKGDLHTRMFSSQSLESYNVVLDNLASHFGIMINYIDERNSESKYKPPNLGDYPIINISNSEYGFMILYTQEALELERNSGNLEMLRHPNILEMRNSGMAPMVPGTQPGPGIPPGPGMQPSWR